MKEQIKLAVNTSYMTLVNNFVLESLQQMIPWLILMFCVVICDLIAGIRKRWIMGDLIRPTKAIRDTGAKLVTYFATVTAAVMAGLVFEQPLIPYYSIGVVCGFEGLSILGNILKPKGYNINLPAIISLLFKKMFNIDKEYSRDILNRDEESLANNKTIPGKTRRATRKSKDISNRDIDCSCDGTDGNN